MTRGTTGTRTTSDTAPATDACTSILIPTLNPKPHKPWAINPIHYMLKNADVIMLWSCCDKGVNRRTIIQGCAYQVICAFAQDGFATEQPGRSSPEQPEPGGGVVGSVLWMFLYLRACNGRRRLGPRAVGLGPRWWIHRRRPNLYLHIALILSYMSARQWQRRPQYQQRRRWTATRQAEYSPFLFTIYRFCWVNLQETLAAVAVVTQPTVVEAHKY